MMSIRNARGRERVLSLPLAVSALICLAAAPALARQCPRGQFYVVSKKTCMDKAEAAELGIYHGRVDARKPEPADGDAMENSAANATPPAPENVAAAPGTQPAGPPAASPPSPYGELSLESFPKRQ